jgi:hypothetical protein
MINENFIYLGVCISLWGGFSYIRDTVRGNIQPNRVSWGLWGLGVMIAFAAEIDQGVGLQSLATFMTGFVPLLVFFASFINPKAYWKITSFDMLCGSFSLLGIVLWYVTQQANVAIVFAIFADLMAGVPTLMKSYHYPESENWVEFATSFISMSIAMLTFETWTFAYYAFPLYIVCYNLSAFVLIKFELGKHRA